MSKEKPSLPKGTRDFSPAVVAKRNYIFATIKKTFEKFGYQPLETPAMENLSVLTGKYGEEGDQLMFKILNNGLHDKKEPEKEKLKVQWDKLLQQPYSTPDITERALRYDLTVPFARFVVMNRNEIAFPFKRYQIQPVWRADRPQRGRYREFYQCDADVVGTRSLLCEAEIVLMIDEVLTNLGLTDFTIHINNRKILRGIVATCEIIEKESIVLAAIDKLDKIGMAGVQDELKLKGIVEGNVNKIGTILTDVDNCTLSQPNLTPKNKFLTRIEALKFHLNLIVDEKERLNALKGINEVLAVINYLESFDLNFSKLHYNPDLARGLSYYTGCILEVKVNNVNMGSISGGGRYDNLTGMFGLPDVSGVGFSFGVDRIYDVLEELNLFPASAQTSTQVLITNFDQAAERYALPILQQLRDAGIATELYPDQAKLKKQMTYADQKNIPYVLLVGSDEMASGQLQLKNMQTGEQQQLFLEQIIGQLSA